MGQQHPANLDVVTGAFSYSGAAITAALLATGRRVRTLTGHPDRAQTGTPVEVRPLDFDDPTGLVDSLRGAQTLYNTYWVRFPRGRINHDVAGANCRTLFHAARTAGVDRIVHLSITHPDIASPYPYFRGKALAERALAETGISYAVLRPAILFGGDGVLLNNIAWLLRRFPIFAVGGTGGYPVRPIHVDDLARLCVAAGASDVTSITDAVGPERPSFLDLVRTIAEAVRSRARIVPVPETLIPPLAAALGLALRDVLLTAEEYRAMAAGLADTEGPTTGTVRLSEWIASNADALGIRYASEISRHFR
ncbi:NAD(P)H-binding protein [Actinopolymorpha pittospori]|uniref:NADH dehydrogenase n=3 Tax=Actinopolymorpha pittospori TaxID=648752 RepID=A0A927MUC3_9ACTN|nr:NADH dehydrogenase [Actinopolymorpha pittospori]